MGFFDRIKSELIDIIEWLDDSHDTLVHRFERFDNEIKYGAQLIVREGQTAVFINEGKIADIFKPGTHTLTTQNLPILTTLQGWKYGFHSPFKAEVYFCSMRLFTSLKWGTPGPATMRDKDLGAVRVTAFGIYSIRIKDPALFIKEIVGTDGHFTTEGISDNLRGKISTRVKEAMPEAKIPVLELEGKVVQLGETIKERIAPAFTTYGLELTEIQVQDIGLPEEVERAIDKGGAIKALGGMQAYTQLQTADAIPIAAANPGGLAATGVGIGMGFGMASQVGPALAGQFAGVSQTPPPLPTWFVAIDAKQTGPFLIDALQQQVAAGELTRETLVWRTGMEQWIPAAQASELATLFANVPPPLPR